jgi:polyisoprenoid-binding protein YceI
MKKSVFSFIKISSMIEPLKFELLNFQGEKMKQMMGVVFSLALSMGAIAADKPMSAQYKIDNAATKVKWIADKKVGSGHNGFVSVKEGHLVFQGDVITGGEITVDMNSITVADIPATDEYNGKLVGHLKAPDFFDVAKYPSAKLTIKGSEKTKNGLKIKGDLTFIGQTNPIEFEAAISKKDQTINAKSDVLLDRTKWGLKYNSENWFKQLAGDKIIKDNFTLSVDITAKK